jgi:hypothetical protein
MEERREGMAAYGADCLGFRHSPWCHHIGVLWWEWVFLGDKQLTKG